MLASLLLRGRGREPLLIRKVATLSSGFQRSNAMLHLINNNEQTDKHK